MFIKKTRDEIESEKWDLINRTTVKLIKERSVIYIQLALTKNTKHLINHIMFSLKINWWFGVF